MISQLIQKIQKTKAPICVGLDPMLGYIPNHIVQRAFKDFGETMEGAAEAVWQFNKEIIDNTYDLIPSVKPQIAMYEQFGIEGLKIYARSGPLPSRRHGRSSTGPTGWCGAWHLRSLSDPSPAEERCGRRSSADMPAASAPPA